MFQSLFEKAKGAVQDAAGKVKEQANGMAKLLNGGSSIVGANSYLVKPDQLVLKLLDAPVFTMKCPVEKSSVTFAGQAEISEISSYLNHRFGKQYLIVNLSDVPYDYSMFQGHVQEFFFPGYPAPPIKVLVQMCVMAETWTKQQQQQIAKRAKAKGSAATAEERDGPVVLFHCKSGKGRTAVALACYLAWISACASPMEALDRVCEALAMPVEMVTIPSQRRYIEYFTNILDGAKPAARKLILSRVIVHSVPQFGATSPGTSERPGQKGCHPELRVVKNGKVVFRGEHATIAPGKSGGDRGAVRAGDGSIKFQLDLETQEDIVLSCYHVERTGGAPGSKWKRVFMFRAQFYTGFVKEHMLRFTKAALDGTTDDDSRFSPDFFIEAFFESHPVGNDYRLPASWKAINERSRRVKAEEQAERERAARKAQRKREKKEAKARKKAKKDTKNGVQASQRDVQQHNDPADQASGEGSVTRSNAGAQSNPSQLTKSRARRVSGRTPRADTGRVTGSGGGYQVPDATTTSGVASGPGEEYYSSSTDSDSTTSGAQSNTKVDEFHITFSEGEEDEDPDVSLDPLRSGVGKLSLKDDAPGRGRSKGRVKVVATTPDLPRAAATTATSTTTDNNANNTSGNNSSTAAPHNTSAGYLTESPLAMPSPLASMSVGSPTVGATPMTPMDGDDSWMERLDAELHTQFGDLNPTHDGQSAQTTERSSSPGSAAKNGGDQNQDGATVGANSTGRKEEEAVGLNPAIDAKPPQGDDNAKSSGTDTSGSRPSNLPLDGLGGSTESLSSGVGGSCTTPSSTTTVENSDGWDACAVEKDYGDVVALGVNETMDDNDAALADIESFLSNLES